MKTLPKNYNVIKSAQIVLVLFIFLNLAIGAKPGFAANSQQIEDKAYMIPQHASDDYEDVEVCTEVVFAENFEDGEVYNNPTWIPRNDRFSVVNGELHSDGARSGATDILSNSFRSLVTIETDDYLEFSFRGRLKSVGNPQVGRGTQVLLIGPAGGYEISIQNGFTNSFPTNKHSISLAYTPPGYRYDLIVSDFVPEYDRMYEVRAIRQLGVWTLFVDGVVIGSAPDPIDVHEFTTFRPSLTGSVVIDDLEIKIACLNQPPNCSNGTPSLDTLWPPNHEFVAIDVLGVIDPENDPILLTVDSIFQDEPVDSTGDGSFSPDGQGVGSPTAEVRAERDGGGNGRVYHIYFTASDGHGGTCSGEVLVNVPKSKGKKGSAVDDGALYDSTLVP